MYSLHRAISIISMSSRKMAEADQGPLTFEGLVVKNTRKRCVTYEIHRHTERRIEFQKTGSGDVRILIQVIFNSKTNHRPKKISFKVMLSYTMFRFALFVIPQQSTDNINI